MSELPQYSILIIDDSAVDLEILSIVCGTLGCEVDLASDGNEALRLYEEKRHSLIVTDYKMEPINGIYVAARIREMNPDAQFLMITGYPDDEVCNFTREHAIPDPVTKPIRMTHLIRKLKDALEAGATTAERIHGHAFKQRMEECPILLGESELITGVRERLSALLMEKTPVLLEGADGVGKLEIARLLHKYGAQRKGPCVEFHCERGLNVAGENSLFLPDGRWGRVLERAKGGSLVLHGVERLEASEVDRLAGHFASIADEMRIIALEGCVTILGLEPVEMDESLYALFSPNIVRLPELSDRGEDLLPIIRAVAASPIQFGLARVLGNSEVEQIAEELKLYDFVDNFAGLFQRIRKMADRPCPSG